MLRSRVLRAKDVVRRQLLRQRMRTGWLRCLPDFLIIGAQRCGTSSLYNYLASHPAILPALRKEVHYFDDGFHHPLDWYRAHFPLTFQRYAVRRRLGHCRIGEASPYYIFHPHAPKRIRRILPDVRIVVLLRNPVDRAISHYQHEVRRGRETLTFEEAIDREPDRLAGEADRLLADERYVSFSHRRYSYLARGQYIEQLPVWYGLFPPERLLILRSEDLFADPGATVNRVCEWLGLSPGHGKSFRKFNQAAYDPMAAATRRRLENHFEPYNRRLAEHLGDARWLWNNR